MITQKPIWYKVVVRGGGPGWYDVKYMLCTPSFIEDDAYELAHNQYGNQQYSYTVTWSKMRGKPPTIPQAVSRCQKQVAVKRRADERYRDAVALLSALRSQKRIQECA